KGMRRKRAIQINDRVASSDHKKGLALFEAPRASVFGGDFTRRGPKQQEIGPLARIDQRRPLYRRQDRQDSPPIAASCAGARGGRVIVGRANLVAFVMGKL